jgi:hypothetical protein
MAKILFVIEGGTEDSVAHILAALRGAGHTVITEASGDYRRFTDKAFVERHSNAHYDASIFNNHVGNPAMTNFYFATLTPRSYILEHDVFNQNLEGASPVFKAYKTLVFTKPHESQARANGLKNIVQAKWYKFGMELPPAEEHPLKKQNALLVESALWDLDHKFVYRDFFRNVYLKRWKAEECFLKSLGPAGYVVEMRPRTHTFGATSWPENLIGMKGMYYGSRLASFWFIRESSMYVEALMCGCLPILYEAKKIEFQNEPYIICSSPIDEIISQVRLNVRLNDTKTKTIDLSAITCEDLQNKIYKLQNSVELYEESWKKLASNFLFSTPIQDLPAVETIILEDLK